MGFKGLYGSWAEREYDREEPSLVVNHDPSCYYLHSTAMDGDEAARCNCEAGKRAYEEWQKGQSLNKDQSKR